MEKVLRLLAIELGVTQVRQHEVHVGTTGEDVDTCLGAILSGQALSQNASTFQGALLTLLKFLGGRNLEGDSLCRDDVHERSALLAREDVGVDLLGKVLLGQDEARARATKRLVHGGGHNIGVRHRGGVQTGGHEAREVRHIRPQVRADLIGDGAKSLEVDGARVGGPTSNNHLRLFCQSLFAHLIHVEAHGLRVNLVRGNVVKLAGEIQLHTVGQVTAMRQG